MPRGRPSNPLDPRLATELPAWPGPVKNAASVSLRRFGRLQSRYPYLASNGFLEVECLPDAGEP